MRNATIRVRVSDGVAVAVDYRHSQPIETGALQNAYNFEILALRLEIAGEAPAMPAANLLPTLSPAQLDEIANLVGANHVHENADPEYAAGLAVTDQL